MIQELVLLSDRLRELSAGEEIVHDALAPVPVSIICTIKPDGAFAGFITHEKKFTVAEALTSKKGKARLLVDKAEEVLKFGEKPEQKHALFLEKLGQFQDVEALAPVHLFYGKNKSKGVTAARKAFKSSVDEKERSGNIAFLVKGAKKQIHEYAPVYKALIDRYESEMKGSGNLRFAACSVCGKDTYPILDMPHGMIKRVPNGQTSGCALVSFNDTAYESYALTGNENASICIHCGKAYVESLNWLLGNGAPATNDKGKEYFVYSNRKRISDDTAMVYWLRNSVSVNDLDILDTPTVDDVKKLLEAVHTAKHVSARRLKSDVFYAATISGAAARVCVRDWIETSVEALRGNLVRWFDDIVIDGGGHSHYASMFRLVNACKAEGKTDVRYGRIGAMLWKSAITGSQPPLWILSSVLGRIRAEQGNVTADRIALLKLILNRKYSLEGGRSMMQTLDESNTSPAYICGRIFAHLERIQYHAIGEPNAGIRERFFSFASTMPATAFGRLMKLTQHHLAKIKGEKTGLSINLDKELQGLLSLIGGTQFPTTLSLEEQGSFAIGYYHQREKQFSKNGNTQPAESEPS